MSAYEQALAAQRALAYAPVSIDEAELAAQLANLPLRPDTSPLLAAAGAPTQLPERYAASLKRFLVGEEAAAQDFSPGGYGDSAPPLTSLFPLGINTSRVVDNLATPDTQSRAYYFPNKMFGPEGDPSVLNIPPVSVRSVAPRGPATAEQFNAMSALGIQPAVTAAPDTQEPLGAYANPAGPNVVDFNPKSTLPADMRQSIEQGILSGQIAREQVDNVYNRGGAGGFIEIEGADGQIRRRFVDESGVENAARAAAPVVEDPIALAQLAAAGLTERGGIVEDRNGIPVEVPASRAQGNYTPEQMNALISARLAPETTPEARLKSRELDILEMARMGETQARILAAKADIADAQRLETQVVQTPEGAILINSQTGEPIRQVGGPRPPSEREEPLRTYKFGTDRNAPEISEHPEVVRFLGTIGADDYDEAVDYGRQYLRTVTADSLEDIADDPNAQAGLLSAIRQNPAILQKARDAAQSDEAKAALADIERVISRISGGAESSRLDLSSIPD